MHEEVKIICCKNCGNRWESEHKHDFCPGCGSTSLKVCDESDIPNADTPR